MTADTKPPYRSPIFRLLNRLVRILRVKNKSYDNCLLFINDLSTLKPSGLDSDYRFKLLTIDRIEELHGFPLGADVYRKRLEAGHTCMIAEKDGKALGFHWACFDRATHMFGTDTEWTTFKLPKDTAYLYDFLVLPDNRGRFIGPQLAKKMAENMAARGYKYTLTTIFFENRTSIKIALRSGAVPLGFEHLYQIGPLRLWFLGTAKEKEMLTKWCADL